MLQALEDVIALLAAFLLLVAVNRKKDALVHNHFARRRREFEQPS
jgi:hypothetical protein